MGDVWQEHRRFLTAVLGGLLAFWVAYLLVGEIFGGERTRWVRMKTSAQRTLRSSKLPPGADHEATARDRQRVEKAVEDLAKQLSRVPQASYQLAGSEGSPENHYGSKVDELRRSFVEELAVRNVPVEGSLGLPRQTPQTPADIDWYLRGLDVVRQLLALCLETDAAYPGQLARVPTIQIEKPRARQDAGKQRGSEELVEALPVRFVVVGEPAAIDEILRALALPPSEGRYLRVQSARIRSLDEIPQVGSRRRRGSDPRDYPRVELTLEVAALRVASLENSL